MKKHTIYRGFSLIELLVVISIITLLLGLSLPSLQMARRSANKTRCASNLKNIGTVWAVYCDQYPNTMPAAVSLPEPVDIAPPGEITIMQVLAPHMHNHTMQIYECPQDDVGYFKERQISYEYLPGLAITFDPDNIAELVNLSRRNPAQLPILADAEIFHEGPSDATARQTVYHDTHVDWLLSTTP